MKIDKNNENILIQDDTADSEPIGLTEKDKKISDEICNQVKNK